MLQMFQQQKKQKIIINIWQKLLEKRETLGKKIAQKYFTALGRERYGLYRTYNNNIDMAQKFLE